MRSCLVRLTSVLFTVHTFTVSPLYTATVLLDDAIIFDPFADSIDMFPVLVLLTYSTFVQQPLYCALMSDS